MVDTAQVADDAPLDPAPIEPRLHPRWPRARIVRWVVAGLGVLVLLASCSASVAYYRAHMQWGCCGVDRAAGQIWYCREPDAAHPVGELYLLRTSQVEKQHSASGALVPWPDRVETGHVGTPLRWEQPVGGAVLAVDLAVVPHTNEVLPDETTSVLVREGEVTVVLDRGLGKAGSACPAPPTSMSTPAS